MAQSRVQSARDDAMAAERIRQQSLEHEAQAVNEGARTRYNDFQGQEDQKAQTLGDYFNKQNLANGTKPEGTPAAATPTDTTPTSSNVLVQAEQAKQMGKAKAYSDQQGSALGNLRAFGDLLGGISRLQARDAGTIGQIGGFEKGSASVLPYELDAAGHAGDGMKMIGDLAGGFGSLGVSAGLKGGSIGNMFGSTPAVANGGFSGGAAAAGFGAAKAPSFAQPGNFYGVY
jgi:hypothetical protein